MGMVEDVGSMVSIIKRGDRVIAPFAFSASACPLWCQSQRKLASFPTILEGRVTDERDVPPGDLINHGVSEMPRPITIRSLGTVTRETGKVNISGNIWRILAFGQSHVSRNASRERAHRPRAVWYSDQV